MYAQVTTDRISASRGASNQVVNVELTGTPGSVGLRVKGSDAFRQRIEAELELLRASPSARQMLAEFDRATANGNTLTIRTLVNVEKGPAPSIGGNIRCRHAASRLFPAQRI